MDTSPSPWYVFQFHQEANSPYLYKLAEDQRFWIERNTLPYIDLGIQVDTININKSNYTCDKENSNHFMHCMENYYSGKLGCTLPWVLKNNVRNDSLNRCKGKEKFDEFNKTIMNILKPEASKELINKGCFVPNCMQRSWTIRNQKTMEIKRTGFEFEMPQHTKVLVREEVKLYTLINFFAEVGGYLGLLLGESLLSYLITASKLTQSLKRKFKECCSKADDKPEPCPA